MDNLSVISGDHLSDVICRYNIQINMLSKVSDTITLI